MTQLALDLPEFVTPSYEPDLTIAERFAEFHSANPWVADALERLTEDWLAHGHTRVGIGALVEVLRWQHGRATVGDAFKINNDFRSRYARLLIERRPEWSDVFALRELRAA